MKVAFAQNCLYSPYNFKDSLNSKYMRETLNFTLHQFLLVSIMFALLIPFLNIGIVFVIPILMIATKKKRTFEDSFWFYFVYGMFFLVINYLYLILFRPHSHNLRTHFIEFYSSAVPLFALSFSVFLQLILKSLRNFPLRDWFKFITNQEPTFWRPYPSLNKNYRKIILKKHLRLFLCGFCFFLTSLNFIGVLSVTLWAQSAHMIGRIKTKLSSLEAALKQYETDYNVLPPHIPNTYGSTSLLIYLDGNPLNGGPRVAYFDFKANEIAKGKVLDIFENEIYYRAPRNPNGEWNKETVNKHKFDLWSEGEISKAMGDTQGVDDICNWKDDVEPFSTYPPSYPLYCWGLLLLLNVIWFYFSEKAFHSL